MKRLALVLLFVALPAFADDHFVVERIDVAPGSGTPPRILIAETRLTPGRSYSENDVRQGVYRVRRLPFVFAATYRLDPGSTPDARVVVLEVNATKRFFAEGDAFLYRARELDDTSKTYREAIGYRFFTGSQGVVEIGADAFQLHGTGVDQRTITAQYTAYDLFGRRAFATIGIGQDVSTYADSDSDPTLSVAAGVPLTQTQTLLANATHSRQSNKISSIFGDGKSEARQTTAALQWELNTTDDPVFPLRGLSVLAGPQWLHNRGNIFLPPFGGVFENKFTDTRLVVNAAKYFAFREKSAWWATADLAASRSDYGDVTSDGRDTRVLAGFAHNMAVGSARGRWELGAGHRWTHHDESFGVSSSIQWLTVTGGYTLRHPWGVVRLNLTYEDQIDANVHGFNPPPPGF